MKTVHLARGLTLPAAELATKVFGSFGIRGSGKSNLMAVVVEQLLDAKIQVIVLDPVGIWFSLRLQPDGKHPSPYQIPVLGGRHGDIVLQPSSGHVVGRALALSNDSCVLDISSMSKGDRIRFAADFFEAFYEGKKENPSPTLICAEEAQRIAPQIMYKGSGQERLLGAVEEYAEQARNYGGGLMLNTLRPQKVNKDVTSLMDLVISFRLTGVHERKAVKEWVQEKDAPGREQIDGELPSLPEGHAFVWSPAAFDIPFGRYHFQKKTTYDAGATPLYARAKVKMRPLDLAALESQMHEIVEKAKADDPRALRSKISELERELAKKPQPAGERADKTKRVEVPVFREADLKRIERFVDKLTKSEHHFKELIAHVVDRVSQAQQSVVSSVDSLVTLGKRAIVVVQGAPPNVTIPPRPAFVDPGRGPRQAQIRGNEPGRRDTDLIEMTAGLGKEQSPLSRCARALLGVLAQRERATDSQISALSGYRKTSSSFANALSELRTKGLIEGSPDLRKITEAGRAAAGPQEPLPSGPRLLDYWLRRLSKAEGGLLMAIFNAKTISRSDLSDATGYSITSSSFANAISGLRVLDLIEGPPGGDLSIAPVFLETDIR